MVKKVLAVLAAVSILAISGTAVGQPAPDADYPPTFLDFVKGSDISAKVLSPKGILLEPAPPVIFRNLIEYRYDFLPESLSATQDV